MLGVQRSMFGVFFVLLNSGFFGEGAENCTRGAHSSYAQGRQCATQKLYNPGSRGNSGERSPRGTWSPQIFRVMNFIATVL